MSGRIDWQCDSVAPALKLGPGAVVFAEILLTKLSSCCLCSEIEFRAGNRNRKRWQLFQCNDLVAGMVLRLRHCFPRRSGCEVSQELRSSRRKIQIQRSIGSVEVQYLETFVVIS